MQVILSITKYGSSVISKPPPQQVLRTVRSSVSSFTFYCLLVSFRQSERWLRVQPSLTVSSILASLCPLIACLRKQFLWKMWPFIVCKMRSNIHDNFHEDHLIIILSFHWLLSKMWLSPFKYKFHLNHIHFSKLRLIRFICLFIFHNAFTWVNERTCRTSTPWSPLLIFSLWGTRWNERNRCWHWDIPCSLRILRRGRRRSWHKAYSTTPTHSSPPIKELIDDTRRGKSRIMFQEIVDHPHKTQQAAFYLSSVPKTKTIFLKLI